MEQQQKNKQDILVEGLQLVRKTPCQIQNHEDQNYSLLCINEKCQQKGVPICVYCLTEIHDHNDFKASENFLPIKKLENYLGEGKLQQDIEMGQLNQMTGLIESFNEFKRQIIEKLNEIEVNLQNSVDDLSFNKEFLQESIRIEDVQDKNIENLCQGITQFTKNIKIQNKEIKVHFENLDEDFQKNNQNLQNLFSSVKNSVNGIQIQLNNILNIEKIQENPEAIVQNNENLEEEDEDDFLDLIDKEAIKEIMLKFGLNEKETVEVLKNFNGDKIETMVQLEKQAEEKKKFEGMDNLLKKKKKNKKNKSKILEISQQ